MISISSSAREFPKLSYEKMKDEILGKNYNLSLVFVGTKRGREINIKTRGKTYSPNVLSFPFSSKEGEMFISPIVAKREAHQYGHTYKQHVTFLFIHGLLHLKGLDHGRKMESLEQRYFAKYR